jgi:hypothetical protein
MKTLTLTADKRSGGIDSLDLLCYDEEVSVDEVTVDDLSDSSEVSVRFTVEEITAECYGGDLDALLEALVERADEIGHDLKLAEFLGE